MSTDWNSDNAAHLLRRAGFGPRAAEVKLALKLGRDKTIDKLLKVDKSSDKHPNWVDNLFLAQTWWIARLTTTKSPLTEKLALFWHNHFATGYSKVKKLDLMLLQMHTLRKNGLGPFRELCQAIARDPAMILWLDNQSNVKGSPNQNFARELQELFTTGVLGQDGQPNYTETDVEEAARAFTGWQTYDKVFYFNEGKHDFGVKTFKGKTGNFDGTDIIDMLVNDPATARRITQKLFSYFAYEVGLDDPVVDTLAQVYLTNDTSISAVLGALFRLDAFYSPAARRSHVMEPAEFIARSLRHTKAKLLVKEIAIGVWSLTCGQSLMNPTSVFGWDEGLSWLSSSGVLARASVAERIADGRDSRDAARVNLKKLLGPKWKGLDAEGVIERVVAALGMDVPSPAAMAALVQYVNSDDAGNTVGFTATSETIDKKVRGVLALLLSSPQYQFS